MCSSDLTEEIEGAILRDKQLNPDSPVGNVIVVGAPHAQKGLTPLAFVRPAPGRKLAAEDRRRLIETVRQEKGQVAIPEDFVEVTQFPETRSGKYMRRMVRALVEGQDVGDTSTLRNPESIDELRRAIADWQERQRVADEQQLFEDFRYFRVHYHALGAPGRRRGAKPADRIALVTISNPPVNALGAAVREGLEAGIKQAEADAKAEQGIGLASILEPRSRDGSTVADHAIEQHETAPAPQPGEDQAEKEQQHQHKASHRHDHDQVLLHPEQQIVSLDVTPVGAEVMAGAAATKA